MQNFMLKKDYLNAILLAMSLDQPFRLLTLFRQVMETRSATDNADSITGSPQIDKIMAELKSPNLDKLLGYVRDWNTNAKHAYIAQAILYSILSSHSPEELCSLSNAKEVYAKLPFLPKDAFAKILSFSFSMGYCLTPTDITSALMTS